MTTILLSATKLKLKPHQQEMLLIVKGDTDIGVGYYPADRSETMILKFLERKGLIAFYYGWRLTPAGIAAFPAAEVPHTALTERELSEIEAVQPYEINTVNFFLLSDMPSLVPGDPEYSALVDWLNAARDRERRLVAELRRLRRIVKMERVGLDQ